MSIPNLFSFNYLMPGVAHKFDPRNAIRGLRGMPRSVLLIGQALSPAVVNLNKRIRISVEWEAISLLGEGSMLLAMWRAAMKNAALGMPVDVIILADDETAEKAKGKVTVSADATHASGEVMCYIGGTRIRVGVSSNDTTATIRTKLLNAINASVALPVMATAGTGNGDIDLTCKWGGATGNDIDLRVTHYQDDIIPQGVTVTVTAMSEGAVDPDITPVISGMKNWRSTEIAMPYTDSTNMGILEEELEKRFSFDNMKDGQAVTVKRGTEGEITAWKQPRNCVQVHTIGVTKDRTNPWETAAMAAATIEGHCSIDPAEPFTGVTLVGYQGPKKEDDFEWETQKNNLLVAGVSVMEVMDDGTANLLRMVNNYVKHPTGAADPSWRNLNWVKTDSYYRWYFVTEMQIKYRGFKLAEYMVEPLPGQKIMTKQLMEDILLDCYDEFVKAGLFQNREYYKKTLQVEIDSANGKVKIIDRPVLVTQHYQTELTSEFETGNVPAV